MSERKRENGVPRENGAVWIYVQRKEGGLHPVVWELLGAGRRLADELSCPLAAVLTAGEGKQELLRQQAKELISCGADEVHLAEHELLEGYSTDGYVKVMVELIKQEKPSIVLLAGTDQGRDLAPRAAARLKTGLTVDCTELKIADGRLCQIRPAFGSRLMAEIVTKTDGPSMCTLRPGMFRPAVQEYRQEMCGEEFERRIRCHEIKLLASEIRTRVLSSQREERKNNGLLEAAAVVSGGMGIGKAAGFELLEQLAAEFGGAVGTTRPAAAEGWLSHEKMIGQTGRIISPDLCFAVGISGAVQHMLGVAGAKCIVAVNQNEAAPVFEHADYGIAADYREFLPTLIERMRERRQKAADRQRGG